MTPARIMVVEDERITAEDLRDILTELGYSVTAVVSSGPEAIEQAARTSPDLVLMDIRIQGDMDGVETARRLRQRFQIPVIYLTAHADQDTLSRAREAEPLGYIVKPFQELELEASIEMALHKARVDRASRQKQEILTGTLEAIGEAVITVDAGGVIAVFNPSAERWTGVPREEAVGTPIDRVVRLGGEGAPAENPAMAALRLGMLVELKEGVTVVGADGSERAIGGHASPIRDHHGGITGSVLFFGSVPRDDRGPEAEAPQSADGGFDMVAESARLRQVTQFARRVALSEVSTILVLGESGTGKDVLAKFMHYHSSRRDGPFIALNCAAIPETLLESELFGYEKGAFTDARAQKRGILELASTGTVLLDEIGELPLVLQAKLLRVLEEQTFRRLGGTKDIQVDLRVIAATNRDLREQVREGKFRLDLYYRLNVVQVEMPPLREHRDDIVPMASHFIATFNRRFKRDVKGLAPEAAEALLAYPWPGNVRELRNTIERAMVLEESPWIHAESLGFTEAHPAPALAPGGCPAPEELRLEGVSLEAAERTMVVRALEKAQWNQTQAARLLGITRDTMRYKMKKFGLRAPRSPSIGGE
jgi:PAS domain S-box-containing protein